MKLHSSQVAMLRFCFLNVDNKLATTSQGLQNDLSKLVKKLQKCLKLEPSCHPITQMKISTREEKTDKDQRLQQRHIQNPVKHKRWGVLRK